MPAFLTNSSAQMARMTTSTERAEHLEVMHLSEKRTHFAVSSNDGILLAHHAPLANSASVFLLLTLV